MAATNTQSLARKAKACLAKQANIPNSPLWNMARAANNAESDLEYLQEAIDFLTCKARSKQRFTEDEKEFLKELYEAFSWGGRVKGYIEAASLASHYVNGKGILLRINSKVYERSKIVQATMIAMKKYIIELKSAKKDFSTLKCNNIIFTRKPYTLPLKQMNFRTEGKMKANGVLEAAQNDQRLHKADGHFVLNVRTESSGKESFKSVWSVDSIYDFEPFEKQDYYTEIPLGSNKLTIYDGLSEYMTKIGVAKTFKYKAEWVEKWSSL